MSKFFRYIKRLFYRPQKVRVVVIGGEICPKCNSYGLFHYKDFDMCEECLTKFDKEGNIIKKEENEEE